MAQRYNIHHVAPPKPKVANKPAIASKPAHLRKQSSIDQKIQEADNSNERGNKHPALVKQPSLNLVTPKLWTKTPVWEPEPRITETDSAPKRNVPPSPFGATKWRPAPHIVTKSTSDYRSENKTPLCDDAVKLQLEDISERPRKLTVNIVEKSQSSGDSTPVENEPTKQKLRPTKSGPRTPIPYRPSFRRDDKSPGLGTLIKMWDCKTKDAPPIAEDSSSLTENQIIRHKPETPQGETWNPASMPKQSKDSNSSRDSNAARNAYRNRASSINFQSPKPYVNRLSAKNKKPPESMEPVIAQPQDRQQTFTFDETAINKYPVVEVDHQHNSTEPAHRRLTSEEILANADTAIYNEPSDSDSLEDIPGMNVATYEDFDENDDEIESAVYSVAEDVPIFARGFGAGSGLPGYLSMSGNAPDSMVEIRYEAMSSEVRAADMDPMQQVVPPPVIQGKPKREYHEIDPNVPPPPDRDPPKLPPGIKSSKSVEESFPEDPPPLPPDNVIGRRSMMLSKDKKLLVVKDLNQRVNAGTKKLNYTEVETGVYGETNFTPPQRTNYTDVTVLSESDFSTRDRSGSGTSEEGLSSAPKTKSNVKKKFGKLFSSRENLNTSPDKQTEKEYMTDFEKERNKKKRISGRFLRKKKTEAEKKKKEQRNSDIKNAESDSGTFDQETYSPATSVNTSRSTSVVNTSSGGSGQSSGDGEVVTTAIPADDRPVKWKVLPTPTQADHRRWSNEVPPAPTMLPRTYKKIPSNPSMLPSEGIYKCGEEIAYPPNQDTPKVQSFLHGVNPTQNGGSKSPPKPMPRQSSQQKLGYPQPQGLSQPAPPYITPASPSSPAPPRPPKSDAVKVMYMENTDGGEVPPPIPSRDEDPGYEFIPEASSVVPPSPFHFQGTSKFLESEPLYQIYRNRTMSHASTKRRPQSIMRDRASTVSEQEEEWKSEFMSDDLGTTTLWRSLPEVVAKGVAEGMTPEQLKLQQAQFEVITSQASYLRSLNILVTHFMEDWAMESSDVLPTADRHVLFSNITTVRSIEQKFLQDLEKHFWKEFRLSKVCDLIAQYAKNDFDVYVRYIQNQTYQDRALTKLQRSHERFTEELSRLESSPACNKLPLLSFLLLPMQRVTRLPLLVSAIVNAADAAGDLQFVKRARHALGVVNKLVKKCNEGARKMQQTEQLAEIASQLDYASSIKTFALVSQSRYLVKKGEMMVTLASESSKKKENRGKMWLFLFTDVLFIARKKSFMESGGSTRYEVINWAKRNLLYVNERAVSENNIFLIILEDQSGKRIEATLSPSSQNELSRWTDALNPPNLGSTGESIYETWDCPQYTCVEPYAALQPDELSIDVNDVMQVLKKTSDGWLEGERLRDGEIGWFPANHCEEIEDEHVRARNMKNLYKNIYT